MKKYRLTEAYLDKCVSIIEQSCFDNFNNAFTGDSLAKFCSDPKHLYALHVLAASGEVRLSSCDNFDIPAVVWLENKGMLRSYTKHKKLIAGIKGFLLGIATAFITNTLLPYLFNILL